MTVPMSPEEHTNDLVHLADQEMNTDSKMNMRNVADYYALQIALLRQKQQFQRGYMEDDENLRKLKLSDALRRSSLKIVYPVVAALTQEMISLGPVPERIPEGQPLPDYDHIFGTNVWEEFQGLPPQKRAEYASQKLGRHIDDSSAYDPYFAVTWKLDTLTAELKDYVATGDYNGMKKALMQRLPVYEFFIAWDEWKDILEHITEYAKNPNVYDEAIHVDQLVHASHSTGELLEYTAYDAHNMKMLLDTIDGGDNIPQVEELLLRIASPSVRNLISETRNR